MQKKQNEKNSGKRKASGKTPCGKNKVVFVFGNSLVEEDSAALKAAAALRKKFPKISFVETDDPEELQGAKGREIFVMDAAKGIEKVELVELGALEKTKNPASLHDLDLQFELQLLQKIGKIGKIKIIAVPAGYPAEKAAVEAGRLLR
ncbi:MAG: hypothetical protein NTW59_00885 [Candidatus Diapherotrites archaeon]|nr:hypothetical protein [Candidatus Diapherotrites archaeon]